MGLLRTIMAIAAAGLLVSASPAQAQPWKDGQFQAMKKEREARIERVYAQLNLSEQQKQLLEANKQRHKAASKALFKDIRAAMDAVGEELKKKDMDRNKVVALYAQVKNLHSQRLDERFNSIMEVRKILTQEQFAKFSELIDRQKRPWQDKDDDR